jgi:thioredoxin-dependent peroxiredoxin
MLRQGESAPEFSLPDSTGQTRSLESLLSPKGLVLFFYPGDFTPVCTREACMVEDLHAELAAAGCHVAGISPDDPETHERFRQRYSLSYPLLSDADKSVIRRYGVEGPFGIGVRRTTYLISSERRILEAVRSDFRVAPHARLVQRCSRP